MNIPYEKAKLRWKIKQIQKKVFSSEEKILELLYFKKQEFSRDDEIWSPLGERNGSFRKVKNNTC